VLVTGDAHGLYAGYGFDAISTPERSWKGAIRKFTSAWPTANLIGQHSTSSKSSGAMTWCPTQYVKFEQERSRAVRDLLEHVPNKQVARAADIGCGPGNSTELLQQRFPDAMVIGIDSSADMVAAARKRLPGNLFDIQDIAAWRGSGDTFDVILANAVLQWVPDHASLLPSLVGKLSPGGSLAVQVPANVDEPAPRLIREIAANGPWRQRLAKPTIERTFRHTAEWYYRTLRDQGVAVDLWMTTYYHSLPGGPDAIVEWFEGSGLRPYLEPLDASERSAFLNEYRHAVAQAYPTMPDGTVLLAFPRLFFIATH